MDFYLKLINLCYFCFFFSYMGILSDDNDVLDESYVGDSYVDIVDDS